VSVYEDHASEDRTDWSRGGCRRVSLNGFTFSDYRVVILNWDDELTFNFLDDYKAAIPALEAYVSAAGVVWVQTAVQPGPDNVPLPLGDTCTFDLGVSDTIVDPTNPMVLGVPSPITGSYASQELESDLPGAAHLVVAKTTASPHTGSFMALAGNISGHEPNSDSSFYQEFTVPAGGGILNFWHWDYTIDTTGADYQEAYITDTNGTILQTIFHRTEMCRIGSTSRLTLRPMPGRPFVLSSWCIRRVSLITLPCMWTMWVCSRPADHPQPRPRLLQRHHHGWDRHRDLARPLRTAQRRHVSAMT
jgi:hypothetical protein